MSNPPITVARTVLYTLDASDVDQVNRRRADALANLPAMREQRTGYQAHFGNQVAVGDVFPLVVVRVWNDLTGLINGKVLLDGNDDLWVTSVAPADDPSLPQLRRWHWPARA